VDPVISLDIESMDTKISERLVPERLMATLSGFFGALAALIATIGLYGVMSYMVMRRRTEIGIRMALGADATRVVRMVMRESAVLVAAGLAAGAGLAIYGARQASTLLFGLQPGDPATLALATTGLAVVAILASYVPAHRAARVDPTVALRQE
jgi:ABC-type antimicrobial peptide transport system permease subunit